MTILLSLLLCLWAFASCICLVAFTKEAAGSPALVIGAAIVVPPLIVIALPVLFMIEKLFELMAKLNGELE